MHTYVNAPVGEWLDAGLVEGLGEAGMGLSTNRVADLNFKLL